MIHDGPRTTPGVRHKLLTGELEKSEIDVTLRASIIGVLVLYLRVETLLENKAWHLTAS